MFVVRPATLADLDALADMARAAQPVLHSLLHERDALAERIARSAAAFGAPVDHPGDEWYLFVLEHTATGRLVGTSSLVASAGFGEAFYAFRNDALIHASRELHVNRRVHALRMSHDLTGKSRLAGFHIDASLRGDAAAHLISRARMMYLAMNRERFASEVFSLMLGVTDEAGGSPFWDAVGRKFIQRDFKDIERISGGRSRTFIAELMPAYPVYVPLLPEAAQRVIGEADRSALLAYEIHLDEGFEADHYVDIFDAGPVLTARVERTASVAASEPRSVREAASADAGVPYMVASQRAGDFRCVLAALPRRTPGETQRADAPLDAATRAALGVRDGDVVHCAPLSRVPPRDDRSRGDAS